MQPQHALPIYLKFSDVKAYDKRTTSSMHLHKDDIEVMEEIRGCFGDENQHKWARTWW